MPKFSPMLVLLAILVFVFSLSHTFYSLEGLEFPLLAEVLYRASFICAIGWWIREENRRHRITPIYCDGLFVGVGWFVLIPYYLFKTHGLKAFIPLVTLILVVVAGSIVGGLAYLLTAQ